MTGLLKGLPTVSQVAQAAGVSRATVSRTFTRPELLSFETVQRVRGVAEKLGYVPNQVARALSTGRAGNIALIVPDHHGVQSALLHSPPVCFAGGDDGAPGRGTRHLCA